MDDSCTLSIQLISVFSFCHNLSQKFRFTNLDGWKRYQYFTAHLKISGYSPVRLAQEFQRKILGFFFKRNTSQCLSTVIFIDSEIFHLEWANGMISQPIFLLENIRQICVRDVQLGHIYILIWLYSVLQGIHFLCRNNQIYLVAHCGTKI